MLQCEVIMLQCKTIMLYCQNQLIILKIMLAEFANAISQGGLLIRVIAILNNKSTNNSTTFK